MTWAHLLIGICLYAAALVFVLAVAAISSDPEPIDQLPDNEFWRRVDDDGQFH